jgi:excisionase family DNA binding protein
MTAVVVMSPDDLKELIREAVREEIASVRPAAAPSALVDKRECARALGVSTATVDRLCATQRIPFVVVGDVRRFDLEAVRAALESVPAEAPKPTVKLGGVRLLSRRTA